jgi:hypothetical protein
MDYISIDGLFVHSQPPEGLNMSTIKRKRKSEAGKYPLGLPRNTRTAAGTGDFPPPPEVLAERDRVYAQPWTLGTLLLGEPLPGRSALARREAVR